MSLINQVLRELEQRRPAGDTRATPQPPAGTRPGRRRPVAVWWFMAAAGIGIGAFWITQATDPDGEHPETWLAGVETLTVATNAEPTTDPSSSAAGDTALAIPTPSPRTRQSNPPGIPSNDPPTDPPTTSSAPANARPPTATADDPAADGDDAGTPQRQEAPDPQPDTVSVADSGPRSPSADISIRRADDQEPEDELARARRALAAGHTGRAERLLRDVLADDAAQDEARELLVALLLRERRADAAHSVLEQGTEYGSEPSRFARRLGRMALEHGDAAGAVNLLRAHEPPIARAPEHHQLLAVAYRQLGDDAAAETVYRQLTTIVPERAAAWLGLATTLESLDRPDEAREAYRAVLGTRDDARAGRYARQRLEALASRPGETR